MIGEPPPGLDVQKGLIHGCCDSFACMAHFYTFRICLPWDFAMCKSGFPQVKGWIDNVDPRVFLSVAYSPPRRTTKKTPLDKILNIIGWPVPWQNTIFKVSCQNMAPNICATVTLPFVCFTRTHEIPVRPDIFSEKCGFGRNVIWRCMRWWDFSFWRCTWLSCIETWIRLKKVRPTKYQLETVESKPGSNW